MGGLREVYAGAVRRQTRRRQVVDASVAVILTVGAIVRASALAYPAPAVFAITAVGICTGSVAVRRMFPRSALISSLATLVAYQRLTHDQKVLFPIFAVLLISYSVGSNGASRRDLPRLAGLVTFAFICLTAVDANTGAFSLSSLLGHAAILVVLPMTAGLIVARRWELTAQLAMRTEQLQIEQDLRLSGVTVEERHRVARDLHDLVAHSVSVMVIQAGAARMYLPQDSRIADEALGVVVDTGREALADLRRTLGMVGEGDECFDAADFGVADLGAMVDKVAASGLLTTLSICGRPVDLPAALERMIYRLVQEALTNVVKHAAHSMAEVSVAYQPNLLEVRIINTRPPDRATRDVPAQSGHGLVGMRERVAAFGGDLGAAATLDGGYEVRALLPLNGGRIDTEGARPHQRSEPFPASWQLAGITAGLLAVLEVEVVTSSHRQGPLVLNAAVVAVAAVLMLLSRTRPLLFLVGVEIAAIPLSHGLTAINAPTLTSTYVMVVPILVVAAGSSLGRSVLGLSVVIAEGVGTGLYWHVSSTSIVGLVPVAIAVWAVGRVVRDQRQMTSDLRRLSLALATEQGERERLAVDNERNRIVHEIHSRVAELVVGMIVQAEATRDRLRLGLAAEQSRADIGAIEGAGRRALSEMRDVLGLLRGPGEPGELRPTTGVPSLLRVATAP